MWNSEITQGYPSLLYHNCKGFQEIHRYKKDQVFANFLPMQRVLN